MFLRWRLSGEREGGKSHSSSHPQDLLLGTVGWPPSPWWLSNQMQMGLQEKVPPVLKMLWGRSRSGQLEEQNPQSSGAVEAPRVGV